MADVEELLIGPSGPPNMPVAAMPANGVSIYGVLREIYDQSERAISNTGVALDGGTVVDVFTIAGGPIMILGLWVEITEAVSGNACVINFLSDPTVGASTTDISEGTAGADLNALALGTVVYLNGDSQDVMVNAVHGTNLPHMALNNMGIYCPVGGIDMVLANSDPTSGIGTLWLRYKPLGRGVVVT